MLCPFCQIEMQITPTSAVRCIQCNSVCFFENDQLRKIIMPGKQNNVIIDYDKNQTSVYNHRRILANIIEVNQILPINPNNIELWIDRLLKLKAFS